MAKQDILAMTSKFDVMKTLPRYWYLWDDQVNQHLINLSKQYNLDNYGDEDIHVDLLPRKRVLSTCDNQSEKGGEHMRRSPFDFNRDGEMDSFEKAAEFSFLNDLLHGEESDEDDLFEDSDNDGDWDD